MSEATTGTSFLPVVPHIAEPVIGRRILTQPGITQVAAKFRRMTL